jgi:hypothetical protein
MKTIQPVKRRHYGVSALLLGCALVLGACFSVFDADDGKGAIVISGLGRAAAMPVPSGIDHHLVTLTGPGGTTISETVRGDTASFTVEPGAWDIEVWGRDSANAKQSIGRGSASVQAGAAASPVAIKMALYHAVSNYTELTALLPTYPLLPDFDTDYDHWIEVTAPIIVSGQIEIPANLRLTLSASGNGAITNGSSDVLILLPSSSPNTVLTLRDITLTGYPSSSDSVVRLHTGAKLVMESGSAITGNTTGSTGAGVYVANGGTLEMHAGSGISGNTATSAVGGGVYVAGGGTFTMYGGTISGNTSGGSNGGGVYVNYGTSSVMGGVFTMEGGTIRNNQAQRGGGVYINGSPNSSAERGVFRKTGGTIYGDGNPADANTASVANGGRVVYYHTGGSPTGYYRSDTLEEGDNISTAAGFPTGATPGDTLNNWTIP